MVGRPKLFQVDSSTSESRCRGRCATGCAAAGVLGDGTANHQGFDFGDLAVLNLQTKRNRRGTAGGAARLLAYGADESDLSGFSVGNEQSVFAFACDGLPLRIAHIQLHAVL